MPDFHTVTWLHKSVLAVDNSEVAGKDRLAMKFKDIFHPTFNEEYELAKNQGDKRFGTACKHDDVKNHICQRCGRTVK